VEFQRVFETELPYVWTSLRRLGVPERDRADVAQQVFLAVHRQLDHYDPSRPLRPWLFAFAARAASDYRKLSRVRHETLGEEPRPDPVAGGALAVDDDLANRSLLARALAELDHDKRVILILHELEEQPVPEIARVLGVPVQTAYSRLRAARDELAEVVRRLCQRGGGP
jgi:RNA polymerase sigma-70 factor (ECF subfamily)